MIKGACETLHCERGVRTHLSAFDLNRLSPFHIERLHSRSVANQQSSPKEAKITSNSIHDHLGPAFYRLRLSEVATRGNQN